IARCRHRVAARRFNVNMTTIVIFAAVLAVILIALGLIVLWRRRSRRLQEQFGPEYKHAVRKYGDARKAEEELAAREKRVRKLEVVTNYRAGREIAARNKSGEATTEDLRRAMMLYRSLFEEVMEVAEPATTKEAIR